MAVISLDIDELKILIPAISLRVAFLENAETKRVSEFNLALDLRSKLSAMLATEMMHEMDQHDENMDTNFYSNKNKRENL